MVACGGAITRLAANISDADLLYIIMRIPMTLLGFLLTFSNQLIYSARSFALEICAPSSLPDQVGRRAGDVGRRGVDLVRGHSRYYSSAGSGGKKQPNPGGLNLWMTEGG